MNDRIGDHSAGLPIVIVTHVVRNKPSASNPRQPRPLKARFLPSLEFKIMRGGHLGSLCPPTRAIASHHACHWWNVAVAFKARTQHSCHQTQSSLGNQRHLGAVAFDDVGDGVLA
jgi:hypothetical protein